MAEQSFSTAGSSSIAANQRQSETGNTQRPKNKNRYPASRSQLRTK